WLLGGTLGVVTVLYALTIGPLVHMLLPRFAVAADDAAAQPASSASGSGWRSRARCARASRTARPYTVPRKA
ncbi:MAG TPA: hypothetical protein VJ931_00355, partial [Actinomycetota bacterium]|nr:hypothetical protein [Actinomycetota bacterium]